MTYKELFGLFENNDPNIDETAFYFKNDPKRLEHFFGYLPQHEYPYWVGLCDIENGGKFKTAIELFEAPIFNGKSIKERWNEIIIFQIGGIAIDDYEKYIHTS